MPLIGAAENRVETNEVLIYVADAVEEGRREGRVEDGRLRYGEPVPRGSVIRPTLILTGEEYEILSNTFLRGGR